MPQNYLCRALRASHVWLRAVGVSTCCAPALWGCGGCLPRWVPSLMLSCKAALGGGAPRACTPVVPSWRSLLAGVCKIDRRAHLCPGCGTGPSLPPQTVGWDPLSPLTAEEVSGSPSQGPRLHSGCWGLRQVTGGPSRVPLCEAAQGVVLFPPPAGLPTRTGPTSRLHHPDTQQAVIRGSILIQTWGAGLQRLQEVPEAQLCRGSELGLP